MKHPNRRPGETPPAACRKRPAGAKWTRPLTLAGFLLLAGGGCVGPGPREEPPTRAGPDAGIPVQLGDVLMRSLRVWPRDETDERDTLAAARAFRVDRILWIYENTPEFNERARAAGIGVGTTMAANAREVWIQNWTEEDIQAFVDRFTVRNLEGEPVLAAHARRFGMRPHITHFHPDQTDPEWLDFYVEYLETLYATGADAIHRDDPGTTARAAISGGTFTDSAVAFFRAHLKDRFPAGQLEELGVADPDTFDVRAHFKALDAPTDESLWRWRGSPLMPAYLDAMMEADRRFFLRARERVEARTGLRLPWSLNGVGPILPLEEAFDFRIGEFQRHHNQPQTLLQMTEYARRGGKLQAFVSIVDRNWETSETFTGDLRRHIASAYAGGAIPLVPWCMYMHDAPRYYGTVEDYGDLFRFVSRHRDRFDGHELVSVAGIDALARLYSWIPNRELRFDDGDPAARVWINSPNVMGYVRRRPGSGDAVAHLVDWNPQPGPLEVSFSPRDLIGTDSATVRLLRPDSGETVFEDYAGATLTLPALSPWGLLWIEPPAAGSGTLPAPRPARPLRAVVPEGTTPEFEDPGPGRVVMARYRPENGAVPEFLPAGNGNPRITGRGRLEAFAREPLTGAESGIVRIAFETYRDHGAETTDRAGLTAVDLSGAFHVVSGRMRPHASILAGEMKLLGQAVERGFSTQGDTTLRVNRDPAWRLFTVRVGIDDAEDRRPCARFQVWFDDRLAYETPLVNPTKLALVDAERRVFPIELRIPEEVRAIRLRVLNGGFFEDQNHMIWAEPAAWKAAAP